MLPLTYYIDFKIKIKIKKTKSVNFQVGIYYLLHFNFSGKKKKKITKGPII